MWNHANLICITLDIHKRKAKVEETPMKYCDFSRNPMNFLMLYKTPLGIKFHGKPPHNVS